MLARLCRWLDASRIAMAIMTVVVISEIYLVMRVGSVDEVLGATFIFQQECCVGSRKQNLVVFYSMACLVAFIRRYLSCLERSAEEIRTI